ncbi:zinc finger protein 25-like [Anopheles maculipalpis]|uniref:zinc finger protein 25-like n=1 Tax=Anopheles maculipalpis TaxID=1496333 RepID=UPI002158EB86|nr:zinc finger protein 25-like [Anopheles maculipalpis]
MGRKCCVPYCCSNYDAAIKRGLPSISTFKFPDDPHLLNGWTKAINRPGWNPSKRSSICINHFAPEHVERYDKPARLKPNAVPSLFPEAQHLGVSSNRNADTENGEESHQTQKRTLEDIHSDELGTMDLIEDFKSFKTEVQDRLINKEWVFICRPNVAHLFSINDADERYAVRIYASIKIYSDLSMRIYLNEEEQLGTENKLSRWSQLNSIIDSFTMPQIEELNAEGGRTELKEVILQSQDNETLFLEEHLEEPEPEIEHEVHAESTIELAIEKPSPEAHSNENGRTDAEDCLTNHESRKSVLKCVQDLQAVRNKCFVCNSEHDTVKDLEYHMPTHLSLLPYHCLSCVHQVVIVRTLASLNKHHLMHQKPLKCRFCDKRFTAYGSRRLHEDLKHDKNTRVFKCDVCQSEFSSNRSLRSHCKLHENPDSLRCSICQRTLSSTYEVKLHMRTHTGEKPNKCSFCGVSFNRKSNLTEHVRRCHNLERPFICEVCGERFSSQLRLKKHMTSHYLEQKTSPTSTRVRKAFHCTECDKTFDTSIQYHSHKRQHMKRFQCSYCGIRIAQLRDFEDHQNTHTGSRPYECRSCGKTFKTASTYYGHRLIHGGEKKHFCPICNKGFLRLRHVQVHMRTHTGEKPYRCESCGRKYADKQTYSRHQLTHRLTVGDMMRAKENTAMNEEKLLQVESMQPVVVYDASNSGHGYESEYALLTNNLSSSVSSDSSVISNNLVSNMLDSQSSTVFDALSQGTYVAELPQLTSSDHDGTILISADVQNIIIVKQ